MLQSPILSRLSDHNPIVKDGILIWNLWAPGTHNGFQDPGIERSAMDSVNGQPYPQNIADIVKNRVDAEIQHLID